MSTITKAIAAVEFQANSRQANAALDSIRNSAQDCRNEVERLQAELDKGIKMTVVDGQSVEIEKRIKQLNNMAKTYDQAAQSLVKGVKAFDELWKNAKLGTIETMTAAQIKAGMNGSKRVQDNLRLTDPEFQQKSDALQSMNDQAQKVLDRMKLHTDDVISQLDRGEQVARDVLEREQKGLEAMLDQLKHGSEEWQTYYNQLTQIKQGVEALTITEKQLRGEIVTREDAMRVANQQDKETTQQAIDDANERIKKSQEVIDQQREEIKGHQDTVDAAQSALLSIREEKAERQRALATAKRETEENNRLAKEKAQKMKTLHDDAVKNTKTEKDAYDALDGQVKTLTTDVEKLEKELGQVNQEPVKPKANPVLEGVKQGAEKAIASIEEVEAKMKSMVNDMDFKGMVGESAAERRAALRLGKFTGFIDKDQEAGGMWGHSTSVSKKDMQMAVEDYVLEHFGRESSWGVNSGGDDTTINWVTKNGKFVGMEDLRELTQEEQAKVAKMSASQLRNFVEKLIKEQYGEVMAVLKQDAWGDSHYTKAKGGIEAIKKVANIEEWKNGVPVGVQETQAEEDARRKLTAQTQLLIKEEKELKDEKQQNAEATKSKLELIEEEIKGINKEAQAIENRREEIAKEREEQLAAYKAEKKRLTNHPGELNAAEQRLFETEQEFEKIGASFKRKKTDYREEDLRKFESRFGVFSDFFGSGRRSFGSGADESEINAYKNKLYDNIQKGNIITVKKELETIKSLIDEIKQASKDGSIEGNPNLQLDSLKKLRAEYEKVLKVVGDLDERNDEAFFEWMDVKEPSAAYEKLMKMREMPESMSKEIDELDQKKSEVEERWHDAIKRRNEARDAEKQKIKESAESSKQEAEANHEAALSDEERARKTEELTRKKGELEKKQGELTTQAGNLKKAQDDEATAAQNAKDAQNEKNQVLQQSKQRVGEMEGAVEGLNKQEEKYLGTIMQENTAIANSEAEIDKQKAAQLKAQQEIDLAQKGSIEKKEEAIRVLEKLNREINDPGNAEWQKNEQVIGQLKQQIEDLKRKSMELQGTWMSVADAMKYANSIGSDGFMATDEQTKMATDALTRHREELIKTIQQKEADSQATAAERAELEQLDQALTKIKTGFASADDVLARWGQHMEKSKQSAQANEEAMDKWRDILNKVRTDENAKLEPMNIGETEKKFDDVLDVANRFYEILKEMGTEMVSGDYHKIDEPIKKLAEAYKITEEEAKKLLHTLAENKVVNKKFAFNLDSNKQTGEEFLSMRDRAEFPKSANPLFNQHNDKSDRELRFEEAFGRLKALNEAAEQAAEQAQNAQKLTNEQMQQGIKLLEEEYAKTDHTTEEGIKKRQQLREAIDQMNQELKESTGEWMSVADAMKLAGQAEKNTFLDNDGTGFAASAQDIQKATQALERQRDALLQTIKAKRDNKSLTKEEKAALDQEEAELQDLTNKLKALKFEQDNFNMSQAKMQELMRTPTNAVSLDELRAAIKRADGELKRMEGSLGQNNAQYKAFAEQVRNAKNQLKEMEGQAKASATAWEKAWSRLKTYVVMYMGFNAVWQKMMGTADDLLELSDKMGEVRKTTGFTADEVGRLSDNLTKLDTRTQLTGLMEFSSLAGSIGLKTQEDVQGFTEAANMLAVSLPEMGNEASRTLMKIADATGDLEKNGGNVRETLERVGSTIIALRANSAAAAGPITDFVSRVGAVGAQAGISIDQIAGLGATVDALGGRVEMSATALSRMIPAIRNNTFEVAKAIGMTEKELKDMTGMEQMVAIFRKLHDSVKQFDMTTEDGMNSAADAVENMLGRSVSMQDVMKELNQQGARAGIVFGLLSQNVDTLEEQLEVAGRAYEKNTALMDEYNKMNDTAAAKWERMKNQLEEFIVGDSMQRFIGNIIDGVRKLVDLLTDDSGLGSFMRYSITYFAILKTKWAEAFGTMLTSLGKYIWSMRESAIVAEADAAAKSADAAATTVLGNANEDAAQKTKELTKEQEKSNKAMKANIITAVAMAVVWLANALWDAHKAAKEAAEAINRVKEKTEEEKDAVSQLFNPLKKANLEEAEKKRLINEINSKYGSYLSKMLTEASNAQEIARAYEAINLQLERKNTLEGINANKKKVMEDSKGVLDSAFNEMDNAVQKAFYGKKGTDASRISSFISGAVSDAIAQGLSADQMVRQIETALKKEVGSGKMKEFVQIMSGGTSRREDASSYIANAAKRYYEAQMQVQGEVTKANKRLQSDLDHTIEKVREAADKDIPELVKSLSGALSKGTDVKKYSSKESGAVVEAFNAIKSYYDLHREDLSDEQKNKLLKAMGTDITAFQTKANAGGGGGGSNPYGDYNKVTSPYSQWNGDDLVARRKEMLERVRALANGADVQKVLSEDAKFITEATRKNIKTTEQAIEWYNTERLKIQDALHEKHLTNTGDWLDPKKGGKKASKMVQDEMKYYLDELDAYYTDRKAKIQEARNDEQITEAEAWRRTLQNDAEWQQRRGELQELYTKKSEKVTKESKDRILDILSERTGDSADYIIKDIANTVKFIEKVGKEKGKPAMERIMGDIDLGIEQAFLRQRNAIGKQMDAIAEIINKERPFNGITKNLQGNLTKMGILQADFEKQRLALAAKGEDTKELDKKYEEDIPKRLAFILGEAENAWTTSVEEIMKRMADAGMTAWADEIRKSPKMQEALIAQLHNTYDQIQEAIKKEASLMKKQAETMWNNILLPGGDGKTTVKDAFEKATAQLGLDQGRVSRANSLIGAGAASERVADRLAIKQMKLQLEMQQHYYNLMKKQGMQRIQDLQRQIELAKQEHDIEKAKRLEQDKQHVEMSLRLAMTKEQTDLLKQQEDIIAKTEESQNRLYTSLKEWSDLFVSSIQSVMEASNAGNAEYYNELAKLNLTGKGGPGAGTYIVIDNEGTEDATAHYEYLNQREALERQHEIERENAQAEAWRKVMDDINMKLSETITDQLNAMMQNQAIDANTAAVLANTQAIYDSMGASGSSGTSDFSDASKLARDANGMAVDSNGQMIAPIQPTEPAEETSAWKPFWQMSEDDVTTSQERMATMFQTYKDLSIAAETEKAEALAEIPGYVPSSISITDEQIESTGEKLDKLGQKEIEMSNEISEVKTDNQNKVKKGELQSEQQMTSGNASMFAKMTQAANLYGAAYQAMSNDNLDTAQKFEMIALQAAGQAAIAALNVAISEAVAKTVVNKAVTASKDTAEHGSIVGPILTAISTAVLGGLMGLATSAIFKSKSQIAQVTGASASAGRMATGMLTYAEGNVNEFSDPSSLTPGRMYSVDAADGRTYRARYTGSNPKTHITNGPEFHLSGEKGREMIIDAGTTRQITMNDNVIWQTIKTLSGGGRMTGTRRRSVGHGGMRAFADGNVEDFEEVSGDAIAAYGTGGFTPEMLTGFQQALERNSAVMEQIAANGIEAFVSPYGPRGVVAGYDKAKKEAMRHGEKYL